MDPRQRIELMDLLHTMGEDGRTILFSSHILEEVEQIAGDIQVMVAGRHAASGDYRAIRRLMTERPHQYWVRSDNDRALASAIIAEQSASGVELINGGGSGPGHAITGTRETAAALHVQATDVSQFARVLPQLAARHSIRLYEISPADESLERVFSYLVAK
jgi:ABC-2 type transport system ATP-binding protein